MGMGLAITCFSLYRVCSNNQARVKCAKDGSYDEIRDLVTLTNIFSDLGKQRIAFGMLAGQLRVSAARTALLSYSL